MSFHMLEASFEINTPMFIGSANQNQAELSVKAIKSAIMFWWRTLNYGKYNADLTELHRKEREIFGSTSAVSSIRMALVSDNELTADQSWENINAKYLVGQGMDARQAIASGQQFCLRLLSKNEIDHSVVDAVKLFGLLGGLGSKALKGFGSVQLVKLVAASHGSNTNTDTINLADDYLEKISKLAKPTPRVTSAIPSIDHCRIDITTSVEPTAQKVLETYNDAFYSYRTNSNDGHDNFKKDCDWFMRKNDQGVGGSFHPERAVFGLPHNYFVNIKDGNNLSADVVAHSDGFDRRQSPLQFHVHKLNHNQWVGVLVYFKSDFLPKHHNKIDMTRSEEMRRGQWRKYPTKTVEMIDAASQSAIISDFMSGKPRPQAKLKQANLLQTQTIFEDGQKVEQ